MGLLFHKVLSSLGCVSAICRVSKRSNENDGLVSQQRSFQFTGLHLCSLSVSFSLAWWIDLVRGLRLGAAKRRNGRRRKPGTPRRLGRESSAVDVKIKTEKTETSDGRSKTFQLAHPWLNWGYRFCYCAPRQSPSNEQFKSRSVFRQGTAGGCHFVIEYVASWGSSANEHIETENRPGLWNLSTSLHDNHDLVLLWRMGPKHISLWF